MTLLDYHEAELVARARVGDADAFGALYEQHRSTIERFVQARVDNTSDAEDLTAQVFLRAWEAMPTYEVRTGRFVSWLYQIARNLIIDHQRAPRNAADTPLAAQPELHANAPAVEERAIASELSTTLAAAVEQLPREQRNVIILRFLRGLDHREVAQRLRKSPAAARVIQHRALNALQLMLHHSILTIVIIALALSGVLLGLAQRATPGQTLYGLKRASEGFRLATAADDRTRAALADQYDAERRAEIRQLLLADQIATVEFRGTVEQLNGERIVISGLTLQLSQQTQLGNGLAVGQRVAVQAEVAAGAVVAVRVERTEDRGPKTEGSRGAEEQGGGGAEGPRPGTEEREGVGASSPRPEGIGMQSPLPAPPQQNAVSEPPVTGDGRSPVDNRGGTADRRPQATSTPTAGATAANTPIPSCPSCNPGSNAGGQAPIASVVQPTNVPAPVVPSVNKNAAPRVPTVVVPTVVVPSVPVPDIPEPDIPEPDIPEPDIPEPDIPEPDIPEPNIPEPNIPEPNIPEPNIPEPNIPEPNVPAPDVPAPDVPAPDVPAPDVPQPNVPPMPRP